MKYNVIRIVAVSFLFTACQTAQKPDEVRIPPSPPSAAEAPPTNEGAVVIMGMEKAKPSKSTCPLGSMELKSGYFTTCYDTNRNIALYSDYRYTPELYKIKKGDRKKSKYHPDERLRAAGLKIIPVDGWYKGYDVGHLAPAADFSVSQKATDETFLMSNMTPQKAKLNRVAWKALEAKVRTWVCLGKSLQIISGPILEADLPFLNGHPVPIAKKYFKAVYNEDEKKSIGFILYQTDSTSTIYPKRVVTVNEIEKQIGYDLFGESKDMNAIEAKADLNEWPKEKCK